MKRLTFGVTSSPFLATQVLRHAASLYKDEFPKASDIILHHLYVDDCIAGAATEEDAIRIRRQLNDLLQHPCMTLRKWRTNSLALLHTTRSPHQVGHNGQHQPLEALEALPANLWEEWSGSYLQYLQRLHRWQHPKRSLQVGDVVLLKDPELFLCSWPLAVVEQVHPGPDGLVRVATLRTSKGSYKRAVTRIVPLISDASSAAPPGGCSGPSSSNGRI